VSEEETIKCKRCGKEHPKIKSGFIASLGLLEDISECWECEHIAFKKNLDCMRKMVE